MRPTLQVNADYTPIRLLPWERAIEPVLTGKVSTVESYRGRFVRSERLALPWPAVIALRRYRPPRGSIGFSARNVLARDSWTCTYCGIQPRDADGRPETKRLTLDHVIPRALGRKSQGTVYLPWSRTWVRMTSWENTTTACVSCNSRKADRTVTEAGMKLRVLPRVPTRSDILRMELGGVRAIPAEWLPYLPPGWAPLAGQAAEGADGARLVPPPGREWNYEAPKTEIPRALRYTTTFCPGARRA